MAGQGWGLGHGCDLHASAHATGACRRGVQGTDRGSAPEPAPCCHYPAIPSCDPHPSCSLSMRGSITSTRPPTCPHRSCPQWWVWGGWAGHPGNRTGSAGSGNWKEPLALGLLRSESSHHTIPALLHTRGQQDCMHVPQFRLPPVLGSGRAKGLTAGQTKSLGRPDVARRLNFAHPCSNQRCGKIKNRTEGKRKKTNEKLRVFRIPNYVFPADKFFKLVWLIAYYSGVGLKRDHQQLPTQRGV